jgi:hypothetical protein
MQASPPIIQEQKHSCISMMSIAESMLQGFCSLEPESLDKSIEIAWQPRNAAYVFHLIIAHCDQFTAPK